MHQNKRELLNSEHRMPYKKVVRKSSKYKSSAITRELPSCSLRMELLTDWGEGKLVEFPCEEEGLLGMNEVNRIPLFISADLAETEAINIISRTC